MGSPFLVSMSVPRSVSTGRIKTAFESAMGVGPAEGVVLYWVGDRPRVATDAMGTRIASWLLLVDSVSGNAAQLVADEVANTAQEQLNLVASGAGRPDALPVSPLMQGDMVAAWQDGTALAGAEPDSGSGASASTGGSSNTGGAGASGSHGSRPGSPTTITTVTPPPRASGTAIGVALLAGFGVYAGFIAWRAWHGPQAPARRPRSSRPGRGGRGASRG